MHRISRHFLKIAMVTGIGVTAAQTAAAQGVPSVLSVTPNSGIGNRSIFSFTAYDPDGGATISGGQFLISANGSSAGACDFWIDRGSGGIWLLNDAGTAWSSPIIAGQWGVLENTQCAVYSSSSSFVPNGLYLNVNLDVGFKTAFNGSKGFWGQVTDQTGLWSLWGSILPGSYTVQSRMPVNVSVAPANDSGSSRLFAFTWSDLDGSADIDNPQAIIGGSQQGCWIYYSLSSNLIYLRNDADNGWSAPVILGSASPPLANSQCFGASSVSYPNSTSLALNLSMSFTAAYAGPRTLLMRAGDRTNQFSLWESKGTFTVIAPPTQVTLLTPSNGASGLTSPVLQWAQSANATSYDVYTGTNSTVQQLAATTTGLTYPPSTTAGSLYSWRVVAKNGGGAAPASETRTFTTTTYNTIAANIGGVKFDLYLSPGVGYLADCNPIGTPPDRQRTTRQCYQALFSAWRNQGVSAVRIFLHACDPGSSQALTDCWDPNAAVRETWLAGFRAFLADLNSANMCLILTPNIYGGGTDYRDVTVTDECVLVNGVHPPVTLRFYPFSPFGVVPENLHVHGQGLNEAYNCSPPNPYHVRIPLPGGGTSPGGSNREGLYRLFAKIVDEMRVAAVGLVEVDVQQELDFVNFTAQARLLYDNKTNEDIYSRLFMILGDRVTYSVGADNPKRASRDTPCKSIYDLPGRHARLTALLATLAGYTSTLGGKIGSPYKMDNSSGINCKGSESSTAGMFDFPIGYSTNYPLLLDEHAYPKPGDLNSADIKDTDQQDITLEAKATYDDLNDLLAAFGPSDPNNGYSYKGSDWRVSGALVAIGETWTTTERCRSTPPPDPIASWNYAGYSQSRLFNYYNVTLSPFWSFEFSCSPALFPPPVNPPYQPRY